MISESVVRLTMSVSICCSRSFICEALTTLGISFSETCCGLMVSTAYEMNVSGVMNAATTAITSPANMGPTIHER